MKIKFCVVLVLTFFIAQSFSLETPTKHTNTDSRIETVVFNRDNVVPFYGAPFVNSMIVFSNDESIVNVQMGDMGAWTTNINKDMPNVLFVKPTQMNSSTNMTVITDEHTYLFQLQTSSTQTPIYKMIFTYPSHHRKVIRHKRKNIIYKTHINRHYAYHGDKTILPLSIYDNGINTFFTFKVNQPLPAIFTIDNKEGKEAIANFRVHGNTIIVQGTYPQFSIRQGEYHSVSVFNNPLIKSIQKGQAS